MGDRALEIPAIVWETLYEARIRLMTENVYPEFAAREFADTEISWRKRAARETSPTMGLLAEVVWIKGPGKQIHWSLEVIVPPIPKDICSLITD